MIINCCSICGLPESLAATYQKFGHMIALCQKVWPFSARKFGRHLQIEGKFRLRKRSLSPHNLSSSFIVVQCQVLVALRAKYHELRAYA